MTPDRSLAALIAIVAGAALVAQAVVTRGLHAMPDTALALWQMAGYFTVLTNLLLLVLFIAIALGWRIAPGRIGGPVLWIAMTGIIYHTMLSGLWAPQGLARWADQGLHSAVPVLTVVWWIVAAPPARPNAAQVAGWLLWPLAYCVYATVRGAATGFWPYPFIDPEQHGAAGVALNIAALMAAFAALATLIAVIDRRRFSR